MEDPCKLCEEKLAKGEGDALFYCEKCAEHKEMEKNLSEFVQL